MYRLLQVPGIDATDVRANNNDALVSAMRNGHGEVEALLRQVLTHEYEETKKRQRHEHDEETRHVAQRVTHGHEETKKRQRHDEETRHVAQRVTHGSL